MDIQFIKGGSFETTSAVPLKSAIKYSQSQQISNENKDIIIGK